MSGTRAISTTSRREIKSPPPTLQGKASKEIHAILTGTLACFLPGRAKDLSTPLSLYLSLSLSIYIYIYVCVFMCGKCWFYEINYTGWGIKISNFSKGHCEGCNGGREVGVVSCGWLASTVVSTHNGLDRWTSGLCCCSLGVWSL